MGDWRRRLNPLETELLQRQGTKEGRPGGHGMNSRSKVVVESGERQFHSACATPRLRLCLENLDLEASLRQHYRCGQAIRAGTDNACLVS
jgi:hypothetical protein